LVAAVGQYLVGTGAIETNPDPRTYITDEYMRRAAESPSK